MLHPTWELKLDQTEGHAALILMPCPGTKGVSLNASLQQLKAQNVEAIVTALNDDEMIGKEVQHLGELTQSLGMQWFQAPIEDDCAPGDAFAISWQHISPHLHEILNHNGKVALHCMGGSGRTGLLAAHLLLEKGWDLSTIKQHVKSLRPGAFSKPVQSDYIQYIANNLTE